jgi:transposase
MRRDQFVLQVTEEQRNELEKWAGSHTLPAGDVFRARLILALAAGQTYSQIMTSLQTSAPTISRWKQRFEEEGMAGLDPRHKGSQPRVADAKVQARIARKTQQKPADGSTHWSCRKMAKALGLSKSTAQRVWAQTRLKPHRLERYMASDDPRFEEKAADIIGLYMNPPQHAAVFCVDEKTAIQALDRLDPVLPLSPGRAERHGFEYYRHGTLSLYAAPDSDKAADIAHLFPRLFPDRQQCFIRLVAMLEANDCRDPGRVLAGICAVAQAEELGPVLQISLKWTERSQIIGYRESVVHLLFQHFPEDPRVLLLARQEMKRRDGCWLDALNTFRYDSE